MSLEQVRLLESKIVKTLDYINQLTGENNLLKGNLDSCQKRIDELEVLILEFKEEQKRIEEGILSSLNKLNEFEDAIGKNYPVPQADAHSSEKNEAEVKEEPGAAPQSGHTEHKAENNPAGKEHTKAERASDNKEIDIF
jgi:peptidoglycan hydrolase CwlO-like protein